MLLKTERLNIRHIVEADWRRIKEIWEDFNTSEFAQYDIPHNTEDEDVRARIVKWAEFNSGIEHMFFAVCLDETVIGYIAFNIREDSHEVGYCFHSDFHGKGYAKESHLALFDYLNGLSITKFSAGTAINNKPSVALLKSLGFKQVGTEKVSFYKDVEGNDIVFEGGVFELTTDYIRQATKGDVSRIAEILVFNKRINYRPIFQNDDYSFGELQVIPVANEYLNASEKLANTWVYDDGIVKGLIEIEDSQIKTFYVDHFFQSQGIGAKLIEFALKEKGCTYLWALEKNVRAIAFYERHGFRLTGEKILEDGTPEYLVRMSNRYNL